MQAPHVQHAAQLVMVRINYLQMVTKAVIQNVTRHVHAPVHSKVVRQMRHVHTVHKRPAAHSIMAVRAARWNQHVQEK